MKTVKFYTLGCKVNQYDTQSIRERFLSLGFKEIHNGRKAGTYLINTCTVTSVADRKSRDIIRRCIKENPRGRVIVTGCLAQNYDNSLSGIKGIDYVVGKRFFPAGISRFSGHTRAFLKIQDGCDNFCSYCKVPLVRGRSRSRPLHEIIHEARQLAQNGYKEIVLTGICLGSYGRDLKPETDLVKVIEALENIEGLLRIRLSSIEAGDVSDKLINKMAESDKLCRHLHIPIQSGDNAILKKMNRKYSRDEFLKLIRKIKKQVPGVAITTDCLVGFPTEKESNFRNTLDLVKKIAPARTHIFPYSKREGTSAALSITDEVNPKSIKERILRLEGIAKGCAFSYKKNFLGKAADVLIEGRSKENADFWEGYTDTYIKVLLKSKDNLKNKMVRVRLKSMKKGHIFSDLFLYEC
jgi:threonylcarbamoyladenosine tRNA methylthiotransferase MtaB